MHYKPVGICASDIEFEIEGDIIKNVVFTGGCNGNHKGLNALVQGRTIDDTIDRLSGITCGFRNTSCPDQLAMALKAYKNNNQ